MTRKREGLWGSVMRPSWVLSGVRTEHQTFVRATRERPGSLRGPEAAGLPRVQQQSNEPPLVLGAPGVSQVAEKETMDWCVSQHPLLQCLLLCSCPCRASVLDFI